MCTALPGPVPAGIVVACCTCCRQQQLRVLRPEERLKPYGVWWPVTCSIPAAPLAQLAAVVVYMWVVLAAAAGLA